MLITVRGGGDLGTGTAHRLHRVGWDVVVTELLEPLVIRRRVAFGSAIYEGHVVVDDVEARLATEPAEVRGLLDQGIVPVCPDPSGKLLSALQPDVVVDARLAKRSLDTRMGDAPIVIGLGPGFEAGRDVHAVVETMRGHYLGRIIYQGSAAENTQVPGLVMGRGRDRVLRAPCAGHFAGHVSIGDQVEARQTVANVDQQVVRTKISGVLRGIIHDGVLVHEGQKVGDIDPRGVREHCFTISDKARAVGGSVLEAILYLQRHLTGNDGSAKL